MRNKFRIALLSMAAVGLVGCADKLTDDVAQGGQGNGDEAENYVVFKIGNIGSETRAGDTPGAGDFLEGLAEEHAVSTKAGANYVYFFTAGSDAILLQATPLEVLGQTDDPVHNPNHKEEYDQDQEKVYQARIKGTEEELKNYKQCLVILNGDPQTLNDLQYKEEQNNGETTKVKRTLNEVLEALDKTYMGWYKDGSTTYFTMSNTVYVNEEDMSVKAAEEIKPGQICKTMAEAQKDPIIVHVERVLAKFELNKVQGNNTTLIADGTTDDERTIEPTKEDDKGENLYITMMTSTEEDGTGNNINYGENEEESHYTEWKATNHSWKVKIVGWGMNATESETYWVKNLKPSTANNEYFGSWKYEYDKNTFGWNDEARVRSYWAVDPHYNGAADETKYPHQYRTAADKDGIVSGTDGAGGLQSDLLLKYNSYTALANLPSKGYNYSVENTFDYSNSLSTEEPIDYSWFTKGTGYDFGGTGYKRTGTHAIVAAELLIAEDDKGTNYAAKTVYQYDSYYWDVEGTTRYQDMSKSLKKYMLNQILFHWSLENDFKELYVDENLETPLVASSENFDKYFEVVAATVKGGDGRAMMQLRAKDSEDKDVKLWFMDENNIKQSLANASGNLHINNFNKNFLYQYGTARRFEGGKMYYYIPIKHMSVDNITPTDPTPDPYEYNVGRYGVVRNHWYKLNIKAIKNPGIPVDDPDQPIIPSDDPDQDYYAAFEIVILPWHVIDNDVTFE